MNNAAAGRFGTGCRSLALCSVMLGALAAGPSYAEDVAVVDVRAAIQTLGFVNTLQHRPSIAIGVVFRKGDAASEALAQRVAPLFAGKSGPFFSVIMASAIATSELGQTNKRFDVLYVLPGMADASYIISDYVRREHVLSISSDPRCLEVRCCILMVSGADGNIVLDVGLARDANTKFAAVFTMMVKRR